MILADPDAFRAASRIGAGTIPGRGDCRGIVPIDRHFKRRCKQPPTIADLVEGVRPCLGAAGSDHARAAQFKVSADRPRGRDWHPATVFVADRGAAICRDDGAGRQRAGPVLARKRDRLGYLGAAALADEWTKELATLHQRRTWKLFTAAMKVPQISACGGGLTPLNQASLSHARRIFYRVDASV